MATTTPLAPHLPVAVRKQGKLFCPACANPEARTHERLDVGQADQAAGSICPSCARPVRADEREPFYIGSEFAGSAVEYAIDDVPHEQALDFFVALSMYQLRQRQDLASQQIGIAWQRRERGDCVNQMDAALLRLQATHQLLSAAVMRKTDPRNPWRTLARRSAR